MAEAEYIDKLDKWRGLMSVRKSPYLKRLITLDQPIIGIFSGNQAGKCVSISTKVSTPKGEVLMGDLYDDGRPFDVFAWDGKQRVVSKAYAPFRKENDAVCYEIAFDNGQTIELADKHRVLSTAGWIYVEQLQEFFPNLLLTNSDAYHRVLQQDVHHSTQKQSDSQGRCLTGLNHNGEQPLSVLKTGQVPVPSRACVQRHTQPLSGLGGLVTKHNDNLSAFSRHHSNLDGQDQTWGRFFELLYHVSCIGLKRAGLNNQVDLRPIREFFLHSQSMFGFFGQAIPAVSGQACFSHCFSDRSGKSVLSKIQEFLRSIYTTDHRLQPTDGFAQHRMPLSCGSPEFGVLGYNKVVHIKKIQKKQPVYDFTVKKYHNYFSGGMIHHNTMGAAFDCVMRIIGQHPIENKNRLAKNIRCLSSSLPESSDAQEQDNTQYLELKKMLPAEIIIKDITARSKTMVVASPTHGKSYIEFMSTKQELQDTGKVQRDHLWEDEEPPKAYREESRRRLLTSGGTEVISLTPINGLSYLYDDMWSKRAYSWRSKTICEALNKEQEEFINTGDPNIACIQIATDDNPIMSKEMVDANFSSEDPDEILVRRYGVFKQIAGRVHKAFDETIHVVDYHDTFPNDIPYNWIHARGIDYHESRIPWSIGWLAISPDDEWFVWQEFHPAIDGPRSMNTREIAKSIVRRSGDYMYMVNLIDPLANKKQANTLSSVTDDLNNHFEDLRSNHGMGAQSYWEGWDTKDTKGYNEIRERMKNSVKVKQPFNNKYREHGEDKVFPTIWFCNVPRFVHSIKRWSFEEWATPQSRAVNDPKPKRQEKNSHDNMVLEAWAKDARLRGYKWAFRNRPLTHGNFSRTGRPVVNHGVH